MDLAGCFIKFGAYQHMLDFHTKGIIYCNSIDYFTEMDNMEIRGDELENVNELIYMESGEITLGKPEEFPIINGMKMPFRDARFTSKIIEPFGNLYCLYTINLLNKPEGAVFNVDIKMKRFGEWFVFIHDSHEFLKRVKSKLNELKLSFDGNFVEYENLKKYTGKKTIFQKDLDYEYQQEYRIFIRNKERMPYIIEIGNIEDISIVCPSENIEHLQISGHKKDETIFTVFANLRKS
jgi:hypothetical protein